MCRLGLVRSLMVSWVSPVLGGLRVCNHVGHACQCLRLLAVDANHPALQASGVRNFAEATLEGPDRACGGLVYVAVSRGPGRACGGLVYVPVRTDRFGLVRRLRLRARSLPEPKHASEDPGPGLASR